MLSGNRTKGVIEVFGNMSKNPNAQKHFQGVSNYYPDVIFRQSTNIYWTDHISGSNWGSDTTTTYTSVIPITIDSLTGGTDDYDTSITGEQELIICDKFLDTESIDVNLVLGGSSSIVGDTTLTMDTYVTMLTAFL